MAVKPTLVYTQLQSLHSDWMRPIVEQYFDLELWDPAKTYDYSTTLALGCAVADLRSVEDNLWERARESTNYVLQNPNWFWYNESLWYAHLGYNSYAPAKTYTKLALMPMNKQRLYRDFLKRELEHHLPNMIWSYVEAGQQLPNDLDMNDPSTQRYFNPAWYDDTYFSIVAESGVTGSVFVTEKTFKPIAFQHPFVVYSSAGILKRLHALGFETFDNLFNESYDCIIDIKQRGLAVVAAVNDFQREPYSAETQAKLAHNHARFFDRALVEQRIRTEILEPLLHYAETP